MPNAPRSRGIMAIARRRESVYRRTNGAETSPVRPRWRESDRNGARKKEKQSGEAREWQEAGKGKEKTGRRTKEAPSTDEGQRWELKGETGDRTGPRCRRCGGHLALRRPPSCPPIAPSSPPHLRFRTSECACDSVSVRVRRSSCPPISAYLTSSPTRVLRAHAHAHASGNAER
ncbi:hypothetical protein ALC56_04573 [Trachymyrmex septentrionalis]|uniref:Uncharacterized protein n=1 Tax=Trachymyrmex septentrionalis TaxID=34720 RepID=A0A195FJY6_9HYME|nr:hypothetical protein ALC56_04573 [Trachymyrmex septentrionalis]